MMMMTSQKATQNSTKDFQFMSGDSIYRHREELRLELYTPDNEALPIPLKYVAVMRRTRSTIDNVSENVIHDNWTEAIDVDLSDDWTRTSSAFRSYAQDLKDTFGSVGGLRRSRKLPDQTVFGRKPGCSCPRTAATMCRLGGRACQTGGSTPQSKSTRYRSIARITSR